MDTQRVHSHFEAWIHATEHLRWWRIEASKVIDALSDWQTAHGGCFLKLSLEADRQFGGLLNSPTRRQLCAMCNDGWTLHNTWLRPWSNSVASWIGQRWYFGHASLFLQHQRFAAICCSQMGRWGHKQPDWPQRLDAALQFCHRTGKKVLTVGSTTLSEPIREYCRRARLPTINLRVTDQSDIVTWLQELLDAYASERLCHISNAYNGEAIWLSPCYSAKPRDELCRFPIQDRLNVALADWIAAIDVRPGGTIDSLLRRRLEDERFPPGSTFLICNGIDKHTQLPNSRKQNATSLSTWLERGAVAWVVPSSAQTLTIANSPKCRKQFDANRSPYYSQSLTAPISSCTSSTCASDRMIECPTWLTHCTRGWLGPKCDTSKERYWTDIWRAGRAETTSSPFETLLKIIDEGCLRGSAQLYRSNEKCVSFSAVPLVELLARRRFQSHLGRWDWEPYGIRIKRSQLERLGARRVIYGTEQTYHELAARDRLYFQPHGKRHQAIHQSHPAIPECHHLRQPSHPSSQPSHPSSQPSHPSSQPSHPSSQPSHPSSQPSHPSSQPSHPSSQPSHPSSQPSHPSSQQRPRFDGNDWTSEIEWRLLGDLNLIRLPLDSVQLFVETRSQAFQLSRHVPWPILWVRE